MHRGSPEGRFRGGFGGGGGNPRVDRTRSTTHWDPSGGSMKEDELKRGWGDIGPNTRVL